MGRGLREHSVYTPGHTQEATAKAAERVAAAATAPPDAGRRAGKSPPLQPSRLPAPKGPHRLVPVRSVDTHHLTHARPSSPSSGGLGNFQRKFQPPALPSPGLAQRRPPWRGACQLPEHRKERGGPCPGSREQVHSSPGTWRATGEKRAPSAQCAGPGGGARAPPSPEFRVPASVSPRGAAGSSLAPFLSLRRRARPSPVPLLPAPALGKGTGTL